ncbi:hypothetical protein KIL84_010687 [Mauremys mutica]|uniref:Uncharacterized protein n=1 Tax=Mauremys mutica TaxID=74926 RepID=A0A9D4B1Q8_9SAUR|nr:hypothetical protein KIL84_010687 [Mauremys mutica]
MPHIRSWDLFALEEALYASQDQAQSKTTSQEDEVLPALCRNGRSAGCCRDYCNVSQTLIPLRFYRAPDHTMKWNGL